MNKDIHPIEILIVAFMLLFEGLCWIINELAGFHSPRLSYTKGPHMWALSVTVEAVLIMNKCLKYLLLLPLLLWHPSIRAHQVPEQCWLPGMVQVSTETSQPTVSGTICTAFPPHIKHYLSAHAYASVTKNAWMYLLMIAVPTSVPGSLILATALQKQSD